MGRGRATTLKINTGHCSALHGWDPGPNIRETRVWSPFPSFPGIHFFFFLPYSSPTRSRSKGIPPTVAGSFIISGESSTGTFYAHFFLLSVFRSFYLLCPATFLSGCPGAVLCTNVILGMTKGERARGERRRWGNGGGTLEKMLRELLGLARKRTRAPASFPHRATSSRDVRACAHQRPLTAEDDFPPFFCRFPNRGPLVLSVAVTSS